MCQPETDKRNETVSLEMDHWQVGLSWRKGHWPQPEGALNCWLLGSLQLRAGTQVIWWLLVHSAWFVADRALEEVTCGRSSGSCLWEPSSCVPRSPVTLHLSSSTCIPKANSFQEIRLEQASTATPLQCAHALSRSEPCHQDGVPQK